MRGYNRRLSSPSARIPRPPASAWARRATRRRATVRRATLAVVAVALASLVAVPTAAGAAAADGPSDATGATTEAATATPTQGTAASLLVQLRADGSARVTLVLSYDLESADERAGFESLQDDEAAQAAAKERFRERMASVVAQTAATTGREMSVANASIDLETADGGSTGVVRLSVTWLGLAAVDGDRLVVTEPFASGYDPAGRLVFLAPDGYAIEHSTPTPANDGDGKATWNAGADLSGFEVAFEPTTGEDTTVPGFGAVAALAAVLVAVAALAGRR